MPNTAGEPAALARGWTHVAHDADIGIDAYGPSLDAVFEEAAEALTAIVVEPETVRPTQEVRFACAADDPERLLIDWLDALVYAMAVDGLVFRRFSVHLQGTSLAATALGEPLDPARHRPAAEIKGATHTELAVRREPGGLWRARCVVDV